MPTRPLRYSINVTLDGCCDHREPFASEELHHNAAAMIERADAMIMGRITYEMMEEAWRPVAETGVRPDWMEDWMVPFAKIIHKAKKYVVSDSLLKVDWNAELIRRNDLEATVKRLKQEPGNGLLLGGVTVPEALAELGMIDEYELIVHPRIAGHGRTLFSGLSKPIDLKLVSRNEYASGAMALKYILAQKA